MQESPWKPAGDRQSERESEREAKRLAVLQAAAQAFTETGYHATSLDDIARRLNVTKPTIYYYVKNKEEILFECVRIGLQMMDDASNRVMGSGGSVYDELIEVMYAYAEIVTMDFGMCLIRVGEEPLNPESRKVLRELKRRIDHKFRNLIVRGIEAGEIAPCDAKMAAFALSGALSWIGRWYSPGGPLSAREIADQHIALILNGLRVREPAGRRP